MTEYEWDVAGMENNSENDLETTDLLDQYQWNERRYFKTLEQLFIVQGIPQTP